MVPPFKTESDDTGYSVDNTVLTYCVPPSTMATLKTVCDRTGIRIWDATSLTDVIAVPNFLIVADFTTVDQDALGMVYDFMMQVGDADILLSPSPTVTPPAALKKHLVRPPDTLDAESLRFLLMRTKSAASRQVREARRYDKKLARLFFILREIRKTGFVQSKDFCEEFNVSSRTIVRDIELLITMGEPLEYDVRKKGYGLIE
jgi:hypothetical protein